MCRQLQTDTCQGHCQRLNNKDSLPPASAEVEPWAAAAADLQHPLRKLRLEWGTLRSRHSAGI